MDLNDLPNVHPTVVHMLAVAGEIAPRSEALVAEERRLTYAQYVRCVGGFAAELKTLGAGPDERVAILCGNSIEIAVAMFGVHAARAQAVPVNPTYTSRELRHILADAAPQIVIFDEEIRDVVEPLMAEVGVSHGIMVGGANGRLLDAWKDDESARLPLPLPSPDDLATLQYTGGTTGLPKGVNITHAQMSINISQREISIPTAMDDETIICAMPLFHVFAISVCLHLAPYCRGRLVILPRYRPDLVISAIEREKATLLPFGPTIFTGLLSYEGFTTADFSSVRRGISGSAPLPEETLRQWQKLKGFPILEGYGQSEAGPIICINYADKEIVPGSVGQALPLTEIRIADVDSGETIRGAGEQGEICLRGPQVMSGYRNRPAETAAALKDGWLHTGDIGELDDAGNLYIRDRKRNMALVGGYNVYPREIDEVLYAHPEIREAASVGIPDDYRGEIIAAHVIPDKDSTVTTELLLDYCRANLAKN